MIACSSKAEIYSDFKIDRQLRSWLESRIYRARKSGEPAEKPSGRYRNEIEIDKSQPTYWAQDSIPEPRGGRREWWPLRQPNSLLGPLLKENGSSLLVNFQTKTFCHFTFNCLRKSAAWNGFKSCLTSPWASPRPTSRPLTNATAPKVVKCCLSIFWREIEVNTFYINISVSIGIFSKVNLILGWRKTLRPINKFVEQFSLYIGWLNVTL